MVSRKNRSSRSRKNCSNRKNRSSRKNRSNRHRKNSMMGGMASVNDSSMAMSQKDSLTQGSQYLNLHKGQYGGSAPYPLAVTTSTLPSDMVASARTGPLDSALASIQGMQDGGRRRKHKTKSRKHSRKHRGGAFSGSPLTEGSMLLPPGLEKQAALNHEWPMAKDPSAFLPKQ